MDLGFTGLGHQLRRACNPVDEQLGNRQLNPSTQSRALRQDFSYLVQQLGANDYFEGGTLQPRLDDPTRGAVPNGCRYEDVGVDDDPHRGVFNPGGDGVRRALPLQRDRAPRLRQAARLRPRCRQSLRGRHG